MTPKKAKNVPVEEEVKEEVAPVDPHPADEEHHNVKVEVEKKQFSLLWAPQEIQDIITFYGVTSQDLFDGNVDNMGLKADELKALKEWYATLE